MCRACAQANDQCIHINRMLLTLCKSLESNEGVELKQVTCMQGQSSGVVLHAAPCCCCCFHAVCTGLKSPRPGLRLNEIRQCFVSAGPVGRLVTSARMYQNDVKVLTFCRLVGIVEGHIPNSGWHFLLHLLHCIKALQLDNWQVLLQVCWLIWESAWYC